MSCANARLYSVSRTKRQKPEKEREVNLRFNFFVTSSEIRFTDRVKKNVPVQLKLEKVLFPEKIFKYSLLFQAFQLMAREKPIRSTIILF